MPVRGEPKSFPPDLPTSFHVLLLMLHPPPPLLFPQDFGPIRGDMAPLSSVLFHIVLQTLVANVLCVMVVSCDIDPQFALATMEDRLAAARGDLRSLQTTASEPAAGVVGLRDVLYQKLQFYGLARTKKCALDVIGFHPWNRSNTGCDPTEAHRKLDNVARSGASLMEMARAVAISRPPSPKGQAYELKNIEAAAQNSMLAPVQPGSIEVFALACNHTCQGFRAAKAGVPSDNPMISRNGKLSVKLITENDPIAEQIFSQGVDFLVIDWRVEEAFPNLVRLIIEADNVPNAISKRDNCSALLNKCHNAAVAVSTEWESDGRTINTDEFWHAVQERATRSELDRKDDIKHCVKFIRSWSGGLKDPFVLSDFEFYVRGASVVREIPAHLFGKLADVNLGPSIGAWWRCAVLKAMVSCGDKYAFNNQSKLFDQNAIQSMQGAKLVRLVQQADKQMIKARELSDSMRAHVKDHLKLKDVHSTMDKRLVMHVMNKTKEFSSVSHICYKFYQDLLDLVQVDMRSIVPCPFEWKCGAPAPSAPAASSGVGIAELSSRERSESDVKDALARVGCEVGSHCTCVNTKLVYEVVSISTTSVTLKGIREPKVYKSVYNVTIPADELCEKFTHIKTGCDETDRGV